MGRSVRQKRKARSSRPVVRQSNTRKKQLNPLGNDTIAQNWNKKETLSQNYRRLGLVTRLQHATGGVESASASTSVKIHDPLAASGSGGGVARVVDVERDAAGRIVRVHHRERPNPLGDPLLELDSGSDSENEGARHGAEDTQHEWGGLGESGGEGGEEDEERPAVIRQLEREARRPRVKRARHQSEREREWLQRLVDKYGEDTGKMARDRRLNPMQQTPADLARRIRKMRGGGT